MKRSVGIPFTNFVWIPRKLYTIVLIAYFCNDNCSFAVNVSGVIAVQGALKFNGGGHINHSIFWTNLSPSGGGEPQGMLLQENAIEHTRMRIIILMYLPQ